MKNPSIEVLCNQPSLNRKLTVQKRYAAARIGDLFTNSCLLKPSDPQKMKNPSIEVLCNQPSLNRKLTVQKRFNLVNNLMIRYAAARIGNLQSRKGQPSEQPNNKDTQQPELVTPSQTILPLETIIPTENEESVDRTRAVTPSQTILPFKTVTPSENGETTGTSPLKSTIPEQVTYSPEKGPLKSINPEQLNYSPDVETGLPNGQPDTPQQPKLINPLESINPLEIITHRENEKPLTEVPYNQPYLNS
nr:unnamed protein product [Callosobruchus chinensis]